MFVSRGLFDRWETTTKKCLKSEAWFTNIHNMTEKWHKIHLQKKLEKKERDVYEVSHCTNF